MKFNNKFIKKNYSTTIFLYIFNISFLIIIFISTNLKAQNVTFESAIESLKTQNFFQPEDNLALDKEENIENSDFNQNCEQNYNDKKSPTDLELSYSNRAGNLILLQGYNIFKCGVDKKYIQTGAVQDDYILGAGDEIILILQGGVNKREVVKVNREGNLIFQLINPISASGKNFGSVKDEIISKIKSSMLETQVYVSLASVRQINVTVSGEVNRPGLYNANGFSNIIDFLNLAGGVKKSGSLRNIQIIQNKQRYSFDLYSLIFGLDFNTRLQILDGANIIIPPLGETVGITGTVAKPGIYELNKSKPLDLFLTLKISGGHSYPGDHELYLQRYNKNGSINFQSAASLDKKLLNGDLIFSSPSSLISGQTLEIKGAVNFETKLPYKDFKTLSSLLINTNRLTSDAYKFALIIKRYNKDKKNYEYKTVNLWNSINDTGDYKLEKNDEIYVFKNSDLDFIINEEIVKILQAKPILSNGFSCEATKLLSLHVNSLGTEGRIKYFTLSSVLEEMLIGREPIQTVQRKTLNRCPKIFLNEPKLLIELINSSIIVRGIINRPGVFFKGKDDSIDSLLSYLGFSGDKIIISPDRRAIDIIDETIKISGAVRFPSEFKYFKNIKISNILYDNKVLKKNAYNYFGLIKKNDFSSTGNNLKVFNPQSIFNKKIDFPLEPGDEITIFTQEEIKQYLQKINKDLNPEKENLLLEENSNNSDNETTINNNIFENKTKNDEINEIETTNNKSFLINNLNEINDLNKDQKENEIYFDQNNNNQSILKTEKKDQDDDSQMVNKHIKIGKNLTYSKLDNLNDSLKELIETNLINISGQVVSPGIFPIGSKIDIYQIIEIANGLKLDADSENIEINNVNSQNNNNLSVYPGAKIFIPSIFTESKNISLVGNFKNQRDVGYKKNLKLSDILYNKNILLPDSYLYFGIIKRIGRDNKMDYYLTFSPLKIFNLNKDIDLEPGDEIQVFSQKQIKQIIKESIEDDETLYSNISLTKNDLNFSKSKSFEETIRRSIIQISGEVAVPNYYLLTDDYFLPELINIAGGFSSLADVSKINITSPEVTNNGSIILQNFDVNINEPQSRLINIRLGSSVKVRKIESELSLGYASISGEVFQPGNYQILSGDTIFTFLKRAGGLKQNAFVEGLIFSRIEEKNREKKSLERLRRELDKAIAVAVETQSNASQIDPGAIVALRELAIAASDFDPIGRLVGNFNNITTLKNTKIVDGDEITIPRRPTSVSIMGEIMTPGSILWNDGSRVKDYIDLSAGFTDLADQKRVFVISPNGRAKRHSGLWASNNDIQPGSVIVVPRKIELSSTLGKIEAITSVVYQLTLTLAGIDNLLSN